MQQGILTLELLDQLFLPVDGRHKLIERCCRLAIDCGSLAQSSERTVQCLDLPDQWIVVAQCTGAGGEDVTIQRVLQR